MAVKNLTITWNQNNPENIVSWDIYKSTNGGGFVNIMTVDNPGGTGPFSQVLVETPNDGEVTTYIYRMTSKNLDGVVSPNSTGKGVTYDLSPPEAPVIDTVVKND